MANNAASQDEYEVQQGRDTRIVWLAAAGMICLLLLAVAALVTAFVLQKGPGSAGSATPPINIPININNGSNNSAPALTPVAADGKADPLLRPDRGPRGDGDRLNGQVSAAPAGPLPVGPLGKVHFRVRLDPKRPEGMRGSVPFHIENDGRVIQVFASVPQGGDESQYSFLPDVAYRPSASPQGGGMTLRVTSPMKTSAIGNLRAPAGFQFFTADIEVKNNGTKILALEPDSFEVRDGEQVPYLPNPELLGAGFPSTLPAGERASFHAAFLVPAQAALSAVAAREPGDGIISAPLSQQ